MANARVAAKDKHLALQKLQAAVEDNERLKQQLAEAQKTRPAAGVDTAAFTFCHRWGLATYLSA